MSDMETNLARINELRQRQLSGEELSDDELREGLELLAEIRAMRSGKKLDKTAKPKENKPSGLDAIAQILKEQ